jgi:hypothetical protein
MKRLSSVSYENEASREDNLKMIEKRFMKKTRQKKIYQPTRILLRIFSQYLYYFNLNKFDNDYLSQISLPTEYSSNSMFLFLTWCVNKLQIYTVLKF